MVLANTFGPDPPICIQVLFVLIPIGRRRLPEMAMAQANKRVAARKSAAG